MYYRHQITVTRVSAMRVDYVRTVQAPCTGLHYMSSIKWPRSIHATLNGMLSNHRSLVSHSLPILSYTPEWTEVLWAPGGLPYKNDGGACCTLYLSGVKICRLVPLRVLPPVKLSRYLLGYWVKNDRNYVRLCWVLFVMFHLCEYSPHLCEI